MTNAQIQLHLINLDAADLSAERYLPLFSEERRREILSFRLERDRRAKILAEILVRGLAAQKMSCPVEEILIERDERGKPWILNSPLQISLSHSRSWAACTVGTVKSGVDVEEDFSDALETAKFFFAPQEYFSISRLQGDERRRKFLSLWTLKESYAKFLGTGLDEEILRLDIEGLQTRANFFCRNFYLEGGAVVGVCTEPGTSINFLQN